MFNEKTENNRKYAADKELLKSVNTASFTVFCHDAIRWTEHERCYKPSFFFCYSLDISITVDLGFNNRLLQTSTTQSSHREDVKNAIHLHIL